MARRNKTKTLLRQEISLKPAMAAAGGGPKPEAKWNAKLEMIKRIGLAVASSSSNKISRENPRTAREHAWPGLSWP
jgi:hypothetical protein